MLCFSLISIFTQNILPIVQHVMLLMVCFISEMVTNLHCQLGKFFKVPVQDGVLHVVHHSWYNVFSTMSQ